jgi:cytochrome oxidase Cu insertion factor (SCO1/SenC/PrrC family)
VSTSVSDEPPASGASRSRRPWLWAGAVLWGVVGLALVSIWQVQREERLAAEQTRRAAREQATVDPNTVTLKLPLNQPGADQKAINITELIANAQGEPTADVPMWSPDGVEDFSFTNCDGRTVTKADLLGRPWAVCFVFTKCLGPCPVVTRQFKLLQDRLKHYDIRLVTLTVDPARDTPEALAAYAKMNGADLNRWYFLTGGQVEIYRLIHNSFRMPVQEVTGPDRMEGFEIIHSTNVMLVDAQGVVQGKFNAAKDEEMAALRRQLQDLAERMPEGPTSPPVSEPPVAATETTSR